MQNFSQAQLAVVAYAQVNGDGTSPLCNSGIATTRLGAGTYQLGLPVGSQNQLGLGQLAATDLVSGSRALYNIMVGVIVVLILIASGERAAAGGAHQRGR